MPSRKQSQAGDIGRTLNLPPPHDFISRAAHGIKREELDQFRKSGMGPIPVELFKPHGARTTDWYFCESSRFVNSNTI